MTETTIAAVGELKEYIMEITYIYHSCFLVRTERWSMLFDYFTDPSAADPALPEQLFASIPKERPFYIVISHHHKDHYTPKVFAWHERHPDVRYIISKEVARFARHHIHPDSRFKGIKADPDRVFVLKAGETYRDSMLRIDAFGSTDCGCSWLVTPLDMEGKEAGKEKTLFHAGDLNAWIWIEESTKKEVEAAMRDFNAILDTIGEKTDRIGYCMFPVDSRIGTHWYMGAETIVRRFRVDHFFPMHFTLADSEEGLRKRMEDACRFDLYANPSYGEYIALTTPYTGYRDAH
ncbi:MAG: MBL fold metallo-hydrolase [Bacteroides sp.]|nr:MBL fold metallo-hydrolase [Bacteroides sp.]